MAFSQKTPCSAITIIIVLLKIITDCNSILFPCLMFTKLGSKHRKANMEQITHGNAIAPPHACIGKGDMFSFQNLLMLPLHLSTLYLLQRFLLANLHALSSWITPNKIGRAHV